jgi:hypothetical protein
VPDEFLSTEKKAVEGWEKSKFTHSSYRVMKFLSSFLRNLFKGVFGERIAGADSIARPTSLLEQKDLRELTKSGIVVVRVGH